MFHIQHNILELKTLIGINRNKGAKFNRSSHWNIQRIGLETDFTSHTPNTQCNKLTMTPILVSSSVNTSTMYIDPDRIPVFSFLTTEYSLHTNKLSTLTSWRLQKPNCLSNGCQCICGRGHVDSCFVN